MDASFNLPRHEIVAREFETPPADDAWIGLKKPQDVSKAIVPRALRIDETRIGRSAYEDVIACAIDEDGRQPLRQMRARPNRWICKLQVATVDPDSGAALFGSGTGLLIGDRYVLTAAHVLMEAQRDAKGKFKRALDAAAVVVIPGLDGRGRRAPPAAARTMPFGWTWGTAFRTSRVFRMAMRGSGAQPADFDYALVRLAEPVGSKRFASIGGILGWWGCPQHRGRTRIRPLDAKKLKRVKVNAVGYPIDKCIDRPEGRTITGSEYARCNTADLASLPWYSFERIVEVKAGPTFAHIRMDHDLARGMSGGPLWLRWKSVRNLIGILHACVVGKAEDDDFLGGKATMITDGVKRDLDNWMR